MVEPKKGPPNLSFQRASRTAFVFTLATEQVIVRGRASFKTDHVDNGGICRETGLWFCSKATFDGDHHLRREFVNGVFIKGNTSTRTSNH
jgi:hypothetical protein